MVANIGDGRGGYLNSSGNFKGLFTPFGGDESTKQYLSPLLYGAKPIRLFKQT